MMVPMTYSGEIKLTSSSTDFSGLLSGRDSVYLGDAPDILPTYNADIDYWPSIAVDLNESGPDVSTYRLQGDVFGMDMIDTYLISISSESGSLIRAVAESGSASIQIQQLTQSGHIRLKIQAMDLNYSFRWESMQLGLRVSSRRGGLLISYFCKPIPAYRFWSFCRPFLEGYALLHFRRAFPLGALCLGRILHEGNYQ